MKNLREYMVKYFPDEWVKIVCFPLTPVAVRGMMFMPDSFSAIENSLYDNTGGFRAVAARWHRYGPAIYGKVKLNNLIRYDVDGVLRVECSTCCASVSFKILCESNGLEYVDVVTIDGMRLISRSCHAGSHFVAPEAPHLTALLQWAQSPDNNGETERTRTLLSSPYLHPDEGKIPFPEVNFESNREIDRFIRTCACHNKVSVFTVSAGLQEWAIPYLRKLRQNKISWEEGLHGKLYLPFESSQEDGGSAQADSVVGGNPVVTEVEGSGRPTLYVPETAR